MTKIEALEKTIYNLENGIIKYNWTECNSCNCGVLARTITGVDNLWKVGFGESPLISDKHDAFCSYAFCMTTSLPLPLVFQTLKDAGFAFSELDHLENLTDLKIIARTGEGYDLIYLGNRLISNYRNHKAHLIKYLKAWVEILKEEKMIEEPEVKRSVASKVKSERWADNTKKFTELIPVVEEVADCEVKIISD